MADAVAIYKRVVKDMAENQAGEVVPEILTACIISEAMSHLTQAVEKLADSVEKLKEE